MKFNLHMPTKIVFGNGTINQLETLPMPGINALIITTEGSVKRGLVAKVQTMLQKQGVKSSVYSKITTNPTLACVSEATVQAKADKVDFIIGLGGGSSIDAAKGIAVVTKLGGNLWDYISSGSGGGKPITGALPLVAITTTSGTGTEADPWSVVTKTETNEKIGFGSFDHTFPVLSIVDPELTLSVPPHLTAYQGFDALFHATEGYIANVATPMSDIYALASISRIAKYLPTAVKDGSNLEARAEVMMANTLSGMVESTSSCTSMHSMEHALSGYYPELPHGAGLIMLSHAYYKQWVNVCPRRMKEMANAMGCDVSGLDDVAGANKFIELLLKLQKDCGVDNLKMSDFGMKKEEASKFAKKSLVDMGALFNFDPKMLSEDEVTNIISSSFK